MEKSETAGTKMDKLPTNPEAGGGDDTRWDGGESDVGEESGSAGAEVETASIASHEKTTALSNFADVAITTPLLSEDFRRLCKDSKGLSEMYGAKDPWEDGQLHSTFRPRLVPKAHRYNLGPHKNFPRELFRLLNDAEERILDHVLCWQERGRSFIVRDADAFDDLIAGRYCDQPGLTHQSFVVTLLSYNFAEIRKGTRKGGYRHNLFQRGKPKRLDRLIVEGPSHQLLVPHEAETTVTAPRRTRGAADPQVTDTDTGYDAKHDTTQLPPRKAFVANLYQLLRKSRVLGIDDAIHWEDDGESFRIHKGKPKFSNLLLKTHLSMENYAAFKRELLDRGFHCRDGVKYGVFRHPTFVRGQRSASETFNEIVLTRRDRIRCIPESEVTAKKSRIAAAAETSAGPHSNRKKTGIATDVPNGCGKNRRKPIANRASEASNERQNFQQKNGQKPKGGKGTEAPVATTNSRKNGQNPKVRTGIEVSDATKSTRTSRQRRAKLSEISKAPERSPQNKPKVEVKTPDSSNKRQKTMEEPTVSEISGKIRLYDFKRNLEFRELLHKILDESETRGFSDYFRWMPKGDAVFIAEQAVFEEKFLKVFTRLKFFETFDNYLTWFGFEKKHGEGGSVCSHPHFRRGDPDELALMKPKVAFPKRDYTRQYKNQNRAKKLKSENQNPKGVKFPRSKPCDDESRKSKSACTIATTSTELETRRPTQLVASKRKNVAPTVPNSNISRIRSSSSKSETLVVSPGDEPSAHSRSVSISPSDNQSMTDTSYVPGMIDSTPDLSTRRLFSSNATEIVDKVATTREDSKNSESCDSKSTEISGRLRSRATARLSESGRKRKIVSARVERIGISSPKPKKTRCLSTKGKKPIVSETPEGPVSCRGTQRSEGGINARKSPPRGRNTAAPVSGGGLQKQSRTTKFVVLSVK